MNTYNCIQCGERFQTNGDYRIVCGVCDPVDADCPIDWAAVAAVSKSRHLLARMAELNEAESSGKILDGVDGG